MVIVFTKTLMEKLTKNEVSAITRNLGEHASLVPADGELFQVKLNDKLENLPDLEYVGFNVRGDLLTAFINDPNEDD